MDYIGSILQKMDIGTLVAMAAMFYFFYIRMEKKFDKIDKRFEKIDERFDKIDQRFQKIEEKINDLGCRLARVEGILEARECCMLKDDRHSRKAE